MTLIKVFPFFTFCWVVFACCGQNIQFTQLDQKIFNKKINTLRDYKFEEGSGKIIDIGESFIGFPYVEKTLEIGKEESLVVNLRGFDCTTFVENVLAFSILLKDNRDAFPDFISTLKTIRYRDGFLNGYPSRLHYFTDWIRNNNKKGLVKDITPDLGGTEVQKPINFMGTHRNLYPFLTDEANFNAILEVEAELAKEALCVLPQDAIVGIEEKLKNGDIIALATSIKGLDVTHTGFAIRRPNGRIHLLHASTSGEVKITEEPLIDYLKKIKSNTGIIVARPL